MAARSSPIISEFGTDRGKLLSVGAVVGTLPAAIPGPQRKRRGPSMSRRSGQVGRVERKGNTFYARFWLDVPGEGRGKYASVRICPSSGPGYLNASQRKLRCLEIVTESGANSAVLCREARAAHLGTTFREQSEQWLKEVQLRKRRPVKARTITSWKSALRWINQHIGSMPLADVKNAAVKQLVSEMASEMTTGRPRFGAKSIRNYVQVVKAVVASAIDHDGEQLHPVKWNEEFLDLPEIGKQNTPSFTAEEITDIITRLQGEGRLLCALLAGSGLRIGEAIALRVEDVEGRILHVRHSLWNGILGSPKTLNGVREIDLHSELARKLAEHIAGRDSGFVFRNEAGGALHQSNVLRRALHPALAEMAREKAGFHAFRRFRVTHLRKPAGA
jgi:integrase